MGTRSLICVFWKGKWYIAQYTQFDGYPEGEGLKVFKFLTYGPDIDHLKAGLQNHIYEVTDDQLDAINREIQAWDRDQRQNNPEYDPWTSGSQQLYPTLSRTTGAGILRLVANAGRTDGDSDKEGPSVGDGDKDAETESTKLPIYLDLEFANSTLFCEWAYVVDLDKEVFEVYGGGEYKHREHRFKDVGGPEAEVPAFVCSFTFREVSLMKNDKEFMDKVNEALEEVEKQRAERQDERKAQQIADAEGSHSNVTSDDEEENGEEDVVEGSAKGSPPP
ncbi:hypothetical protein B0J18DRAFT_488946 [Chaetomium sp. MPI-SDFR-AT-0129]|nr:hypothetical protein B0J18DRAFT_488946 [Chaetomium sp. MPI-SDFR-AT-0129]